MSEEEVLQRPCPGCTICTVCTVCRKAGDVKEVFPGLFEMTPLGSFSYFTRLSTVINIQDEIKDSVKCTCENLNTPDSENIQATDCKCWFKNAAINSSESKCGKRLCTECVQYVNQLEELQLQIFKIENTIFNLYTRLQLEEKEEIVEETFEDVIAREDEDNKRSKDKIIKPKRKIKETNVQRNVTRRKKRTGPAKCPICQVVCKTERLLVKHQFSVHAVELAIECSLCDESFSSLTSLKKHEQSYHQSLVLCPICGRSITKDNLAAHQKTHFKVEQVEERKICEVCSKVCLTIGNLNVHMRTHCLDKPFSCKLCDKTFKWNSSLNTHIQSAHSKQGFFKCTVCGRMFKDKANLRKHEFTHSLSKPFSCSVCLKGFIRKDLHARHQEHCSL